MADWRVARSLETLLDEINKKHPNRSKVSDGSIGNAEHQSRDSDHNPWVKDGSMGIVTARDFTNDPGDGFDSSDFAEWLRQRCIKGQETRVKYIISDRRICNGDVQNWRWRPYSGPNAHEHHVHISVKSAKTKYDDPGPWGYWIEDDMTPTELMNHKVKLTEAAARNMGGGYKEGDEVSVLFLLLWGGPGVGRIAADVDALTAKVDALDKAA